MTPQFHEHVPQPEPECFSRIIPTVLATAILIILIATFAPVAQASPAECQGANLSRDNNAIESITSWRETSLRILPLTLTVQRDLYGGLIPAPILEAAAPIRSARFGRGNMNYHVMDNVDTCWSQSLRKNTAVNQAVIKSIGKSPSKFFTPVMRVPPLYYIGRKQFLKPRTLLPEMGLVPQDRAPSVIGPVQENWQPGQANAQGLNQSIAMRPIGSEALTLFDGRPILAIEQLQTGLRPPVNESMRMNMTTTQALHGGNYAFP